MTDIPAKTVWPIITYSDARAAVDFLVTAFGFAEKVMVPDADGAVAHGELAWPEGGGVMIHTEGVGDPVFGGRQVGQSSVYVVTDDPHRVLAAAQAAGAEIIRELRDEDYGSTGFSAKDPEGNIFSFGTYRGEA